MMFIYLYLFVCQVRVTVGDSGLCCFVRVTCFDRYLRPLFVEFSGLVLSCFTFPRASILTNASPIS